MADGDMLNINWLHLYWAQIEVEGSHPDLLGSQATGKFVGACM